MAKLFLFSWGGGDRTWTAEGKDNHLGRFVFMVSDKLSFMHSKPAG